MTWLFWWLPGFGVGGTLAWLLLKFTPLAGDSLAIVLIGGLAGLVYAGWRRGRRARARIKRLAEPPDAWRHMQPVVARGQLVCLGEALGTPVGGEPAALYGYEVQWRHTKPRSRRNRSQPTSQAHGHAMARCALVVGGRRYALHGLPQTGGSRWRRSSELADIERICGYWLHNGIRPFRTGVAAAKAHMATLREHRRQGVRPDPATGGIRSDEIRPGSDAAKALEAALEQRGADCDPVQLAQVLASYDCVLAEEYIEPGAEVVVIGVWNAAAARIEIASTELKYPGGLWSGRADLGSTSGQVLIRLPDAQTTLRARHSKALAPMAAMLAVVVAAVGWWSAPVLTWKPRDNGLTSLVELAAIALGDLEPIKAALLEPSAAPETVAYHRARRERGEAITAGGAFVLQEADKREAADADYRLGVLQRVLDTLRPDLNRLGGHGHLGVHPTRSLGRFLLLDTRGRSMDVLLAHGADPDFATARGYTALMDAAGSCDLVRTVQLLRAGADPARRDAYGYSAADRAMAAPRPANEASAAPTGASCRQVVALLEAAGGSADGAD
jgi:hypothetical protein